MKVYISCHHPDPANALAATLRTAGHEVVSTWHSESAPRPATGDIHTWREKANRNFDQIEVADALVLIASPEHLSREKCVSGGKFVEAGYAYGLKHPKGHPKEGQLRVAVITLGGMENGMLAAERVFHCTDAADVLTLLNIFPQ